MLMCADTYARNAKLEGPRLSVAAAILVCSILPLHIGCVRGVRKVSTDNLYAVTTQAKNQPHLNLRQNYEYQATSRSSESISKRIGSHRPASSFNFEPKANVHNADVLEQKYPAVTSLLEEIQRDPNRAQLHYELASVYHSIKIFDKASLEYEKALAAKPDDPVFYESLGRLFRDSGVPEAGVHYLEKALKLRPSYAEAWNTLGTIHDELGNSSQALECYLKALEINFDLDFVHNNLCFHFLKAGDLQKAIYHGEKAVLLNPTLTQARNNLGVAYGLAGKSGQAIEQFRVVGDEAEAHNNLGVLLLKAHRNAEAMDEFKLALRLRPFYTVAAQNYRNTRKLVPAGTLSSKSSALASTNGPPSDDSFNFDLPDFSIPAVDLRFMQQYRDLWAKYLAPSGAFEEPHPQSYAVNDQEVNRFADLIRQPTNE